jgi:hypothetical protein
MSSGNNRIQSGKVVGTGALLDVKGMGFKPRYVRLFNTNGLELTWAEGMADAAGQKRIANGTGSFISANGITPLADGFRIGTDAVNTAAIAIHWTCND